MMQYEDLKLLNCIRAKLLLKKWFKLIISHWLFLSQFENCQSIVDIV